MGRSVESRSQELGLPVTGSDKVSRSAGGRTAKTDRGLTVLQDVLREERTGEVRGGPGLEAIRHPSTRRRGNKVRRSKTSSARTRK